MAARKRWAENEGIYGRSDHHAGVEGKGRRQSFEVGEHVIKIFVPGGVVEGEWVS